MALDAIKIIKYVGLYDGKRRVLANGTNSKVRKETFSGLNAEMLSKIPSLKRSMPKDIGNIIIDATIMAPADLLAQGLSNIPETTIVNIVHKGTDWDKHIKPACNSYLIFGILSDVMANIFAMGLCDSHASILPEYISRSSQQELLSMRAKLHKVNLRHRGVESWLQIEKSMALQLVFRLNRHLSSSPNDFLVIAVPLPGITVEDVLPKKIKLQ